MKREIIFTTNAPEAVGPYSQAVKAGGMVYVAGQIALDPGTKKLVEGNITNQTQQVMKNIKAILEASGSSIGNIVKTTVYLANISDFAEFNKAYGEFFEGIEPPARLTVGVGEMFLGALIEMDAIAIEE
jgi:2-iminobutanoate/2-iminopropanoate deaminase